MHDVFLSYSHVNKKIADAICNRLESSNIKCWYAPRDVGAGDNWQESIVKAIRSAKVFVLILTKESNASDEVLREVTIAAKIGCVIIPFRVDSVVPRDSLSYYLDSVHWLDAMTSSLERSIKELRERVWAILKVAEANNGTVQSSSDGKVTLEEKKVDGKKTADSSSKGKPFSKWILPIAAAAVILAVVCGIAVYNSRSYDQEETYLLALGYYSGTGVEKNTDLAVEMMKELAEKGSVDAQEWMGRLYMKGEAVAADPSEAVKWFKKAAEQGSASAQNSLALRYYNGDGVEQSYEEAVKWFRTAAEQGLDSAQNMLGVCYYNGYGVEKDFAEAVKWFKKAAEQGHVSAQNNLGNRYYDGEGVEQNYEEAVRWFFKAAEKDSANSQNMLGSCYYKGHGVEKDPVEAVKWFELAAEQGDDSAQYNLGYCYFNGSGVVQNYEEAVKWFKKAAEQGLVTAQKALGDCYANGLGVEKNEETANYWYGKARGE